MADILDSTQKPASPPSQRGESIDDAAQTPQGAPASAQSAQGTIPSDVPGAPQTDPSNIIIPADPASDVSANPPSDDFAPSAPPGSGGKQDDSGEETKADSGAADKESLEKFEKDLEEAAHLPGIAEKVAEGGGDLTDSRAPEVPLPPEIPGEPPAPAPPEDAVKPKKKSAKGTVVALAAIFFLATTGLVFVFVNQKQQIGDIRNRADSLYPQIYHDCIALCQGNQSCIISQCYPLLSPTTTPPVNTCANGYTWNGSTCQPNPSLDCGRDKDMNAPVCCTDECAPSDLVCEGPNRLECNTKGKWCTVKVGGCVDGEPPGGDGGNPPTSTPVPPTNTPTPSPIVAQCNDIKIYKDGIVVVPSTLKTGDAVIIAVTGGNATKARVRVNGGAWTETSTKNSSGEYTLNYTLPSGVKDFTVESEIYGLDGAWH